MFLYKVTDFPSSFIQKYKTSIAEEVSQQIINKLSNYSNIPNHRIKLLHKVKQSVVNEYKSSKS